MQEEDVWKFIELKYGTVGKNVRIPHTPYVTNGICDIFPSDDGKYMAFKNK